VHLSCYLNISSVIEDDGEAEAKPTKPKKAKEVSDMFSNSDDNREVVNDDRTVSPLIG
jgi:hypothetical protein